MNKDHLYVRLQPNDRTRQLISERNIEPLEALILTYFLHPKLEEVYFSKKEIDLNLEIPNIENCARYLLEAIKECKKILVHGDYDTDGIMGTTLLYHGLKSLNANVIYYIPSRFEGGYGISTQSIDFAKKESIDIILTVDCGTSSNHVRKKLEELNIKLLVTDHHIPEEDDILDEFVINPYLSENEEAKTLAGTTVAYLLLKKLYLLSNKEFKEEPYIRLCGIATISDCVPIGEFNYLLCKKALTFLENAPIGGLKLLLNRCPQPPFRWHHISYHLSPRVNSAGRVKDASLVIELLLEKNPKRAETLLNELEDLNLERKTIQSMMLEEVEKMVMEEDPPFIFCASEKFHQGLLGPVASKIAQEKDKSVFLVSVDNELAIGSARANLNINLTSFLREEKELFLNIGGHEKASGFTLHKNNLKKLKEFLEKNSSRLIKSQKCVKNFILLRKDDLNKVWEILGKIEPIDLSIEQPYFALSVKEANGGPSEKNKRMEWLFKSENGFIRAILFENKKKQIKSLNDSSFLLGKLIPNKSREEKFFFEVYDVINLGP